MRGSESGLVKRPPVVHDCTGSPGYPVSMVAMNGEYDEILVQHWKRTLAVGDLVLVGSNALTRRTYRVTRNEPNPDRYNLHRRGDGWMAVLVSAAPGRVTVAGVDYRSRPTDWA